MQRLWPIFAQKHPQKWFDILLSLSPSGCTTLTNIWESNDLNPSFMASILSSPWGVDGDDKAVRVRKYFIKQKDCFAGSVARNVLQELACTI